MDSKLRNIYGKAYGEKMKSYARSFEVRVDDGITEHQLYAILQTVVLRPTMRGEDSYRCGLFNESLFLFDSEFFDGGVMGSTTCINCSGWDHSDFDIAIRDLVVDALLGTVDTDEDAEYAQEIYDGVSYEEIDGTGVFAEATYYYDEEEEKKQRARVA